MCQPPLQVLMLIFEQSVFLKAPFSIATAHVVAALVEHYPFEFGNKLMFAFDALMLFTFTVFGQAWEKDG